MTDALKALSTPAPVAQEGELREAAQAVVTNAQRSYRSRGKDRYIEDESGELMMLVPHEDWHRLDAALATPPPASEALQSPSTPAAEHLAVTRSLQLKHKDMSSG